MLRPSWIVVAALIVISAGVAACADEDEPAEGTPGSTAETTASPEGGASPETTPTEGTGSGEGTAEPFRTPVPGEGPHSGGEIGSAAVDDRIAALDIDVRPGGEGLPEGSGTAEEGAEVYARNCARCHGANGTEGGVGPVLVSEPGPWQPGMPVTIGTYWPYAETVFDYVRRAMPFDNPGSLTDEEVYAVVAWLLSENQIVESDAEMNAETLPQVEMPNRDSFFSCWPQECRPDIP